MAMSFAKTASDVDFTLGGAAAAFCVGDTAFWVGDAEQEPPRLVCFFLFFFAFLSLSVFAPVAASMGLLAFVASAMQIISLPWAVPPS